MKYNKDMMDTLLYWVGEREKIRQLKDSGQPSPWTTDPILRDNSFCNVRREDDRGTTDNVELVRKHWGRWDYPVVATIARYLNRRESLEILDEHVTGCGPDLELDVLMGKLISARESGMTIFNSAYMAFITGVKGDRIKLLFSHLFVPMMGDLEDIHCAIDGNSNSEVFNAMTRKYLGPFLTQQVVIDMAHTPLMEMMDYKRQYTVLGPGSTRGMMKIFGNTDLYFDKLTLIRRQIKWTHGITVSAHDAQNCLCEFDKYTRVQEDPNRKLKKYKEKGDVKGPETIKG